MPLPKSSVNVEEAVKLYGEGWTFDMLSERYGVSRQRVQQKIGHLVCERIQLCARCQKRLVGPESTLCEECQLDAKNKCPDCGEIIAYSSKRCTACNGIVQRAFDVRLARGLYESGYTLHEVAKFLDVSHVRVYLQLKNLGTTFRSKGRGHQSPLVPIEKIAAQLKKILP
jgi:hypothetical protein